MAAENFWGSIAAQLGDHVTVRSIITNPDADPHDYEPTAADARTVASAQYVVENGAGYDPWVAKLVAANPAAGAVGVERGSAGRGHGGRQSASLVLAGQRAPRDPTDLG
ncbi:MAG TPA: zinc ABC transporter substrate-binding protein [Pseudonocardiaceae bacterium]